MRPTPWTECLIDQLTNSLHVHPTSFILNNFWNIARVQWIRCASSVFCKRTAEHIKRHYVKHEIHEAHCHMAARETAKWKKQEKKLQFDMLQILLNINAPFIWIFLIFSVIFSLSLSFRYGFAFHLLLSSDSAMVLLMPSPPQSLVSIYQHMECRFVECLQFTAEW